MEALKVRLAALLAYQQAASDCFSHFSDTAIDRKRFDKKYFLSINLNMISHYITDAKLEIEEMKTKLKLRECDLCCEEVPNSEFFCPGVCCHAIHKSCYEKLSSQRCPFCRTFYPGGQTDLTCDEEFQEVIRDLRDETDQVAFDVANDLVRTYPRRQAAVRAREAIIEERRVRRRGNFWEFDDDSESDILINTAN